MANPEQNITPPEQALNIQADPELLRGRYANNLQVSWSPEEFWLDFLMIHPASGGHLVSRVILSPGHMKRIVSVLQGVMVEQEKQTGETIAPAEEPKAPIGFKTTPE